MNDRFRYNKSCANMNFEQFPQSQGLQINLQKENTKENSLESLRTKLESARDFYKSKNLKLFAELKNKYDVRRFLYQGRYPTEVTDQIRRVITDDEDLSSYKNFATGLEVMERLESVNERSVIGLLGKLKKKTKNLFQQLKERYENIDFLKNESTHEFPLEITDKVAAVVTSPEDYALYEEFARNFSLVREIKMTRGDAKLDEEIKTDKDVFVASPETGKKFESSWSYKDYTYQQWAEHGFLTTRDGLPSKLDRESYILVRTRDFKEWFGNWEDRDHCESRMIDADTGEPKVFYRGDKSLYKDGFLVKPEHERSIGEYDTGTEKALAQSQGIFFTDDIRVALEYGLDIDAVTLGKYGLRSERDHQKTFPKVLAWLKNFAKNDPIFWKRISDVVCANSFTEITSEEVYKRNFFHFFEHILSENDARDLFDEVNGRGRKKDSDYYIDALVEKGAFEGLIDAFRSQVFKDPHAPEGREWFIKFGSEGTPSWSKEFKDLAREYFSENLALSTVFIHSFNPKKFSHHIVMDCTGEVYSARKEGFDTVIHEKGVGHHVKGVSEGADEIIVFEPEDVWTVRKESLADMAMEKN